MRIASTKTTLCALTATLVVACAATSSSSSFPTAVGRGGGDLVGGTMGRYALKKTNRRRVARRIDAYVGGDDDDDDVAHRASSSHSSSDGGFMPAGRCERLSSIGGEDDADDANDASTYSYAVVVARGGGGGGVDGINDVVPSSSPRAAATLAMATCMSLHYLAYSLARPATMTLFTSARLGYGGPDNVRAYPLAMTFISPFSFVLLLWYGNVLDRYGPKSTLVITSLWCSAGLLGSGLLVGKLDSMISSSSSTMLSSSNISSLTRIVVGLLFVFRESYVQLLTSQHWSFVSSILTPSESSTWYGPISGLTSITSAMGAMGVGKLSGVIGLTGVLMVSGLALASSVWFGGLAYRIAEENGFNPTDEHKINHRVDKEKGGVRQSGGRDKANIDNSSSVAERNLLAKARDVFARVPTLWALFCEILACQCLSTLLNVCFVSRVSESIPDDSKRAGYVGRFYAGINVLSSALQFGILPLTSKYAEPCALWRLMPSIVLVMTSMLSFPRLGGIGGPSDTKDHPSLDMVALAFLLMKTMEFSVRRMLDEMVYVPLDYESRFLGKEVIGVLGYRFGKSGASLALSAITSCFGGGGAMGVKELSYFATGAAGMWLVAAWRLSNLVPTKDEAEEAYREMKKAKK